MTYQPHRWEYDQLNGFWAHCNCGYSVNGFRLRQKMDRHVRRATENDYREAQIAALRADHTERKQP